MRQNNSIAVVWSSFGPNVRTARHENRPSYILSNGIKAVRIALWSDLVETEAEYFTIRTHTTDMLGGCMLFEEDKTLEP
jgi:hypothetical protein